MDINHEILAIFERHPDLTMSKFLNILLDLATTDSSWFDEFNEWCEMNPYDEVGAFK